MTTYLADGIGASLGDSLAMEVGFIGLGVHSVWYVSSVSGTDASGHGRNREDPFASIEFAIGEASDGDTIVPLSNHVEATGSALAINKSVVIAAEGSAAGVPTATWGTAFTGSDEVITVTANDVEIRNVKFTPNVGTLTTERIDWQGDNGFIKGCYFQAGASDDGAVLLVTGDDLLIQSSTFISTGTSSATRPSQAIVTATTGITILRMRSCVVSGGASGWSSENGAIFLRCNGACVRIEAMSLLLGSDVVFDTGTFTGYVSIPVATAGGQVRGL